MAECDVLIIIITAATAAATNTIIKDKTCVIHLFKSGNVIHTTGKNRQRDRMKRENRPKAKMFKVLS